MFDVRLGLDLELRIYILFYLNFHKSPFNPASLLLTQTDKFHAGSYLSTVLAAL